MHKAIPAGRVGPPQLSHGVTQVPQQEPLTLARNQRIAKEPVMRHMLGWAWGGGGRVGGGEWCGSHLADPVTSASLTKPGPYGRES